MQNEIAERPDKGKVMPGCGGLRKLRFNDPNRGKGRRGGLRVIYLYVPEARRVDFFDVYGKDEKDDLTPKEKKILSDLAKRIRQEAIDGSKASGEIS